MPDKGDAPEINNIKIDTGKNTLEIKWETGSIAHVHCTNGANCFTTKIPVTVNAEPSEVNTPPIHHIGISRNENGKLSLDLHLKNS